MFLKLAPIVPMDPVSQQENLTSYDSSTSPFLGLSARALSKILIIHINRLPEMLEQ